MQFRPFVILAEISAVAWAVDRGLRLVNRFITSFRFNSKDKPLIKPTRATLTFIGNDVMRMRIALPRSRVRLPHQALSISVTGAIGAGDDIMLTVPRIQLVGDHPFSVMRAGEAEGETFIELGIKAKAGLTRKLLSYKNTDTESLEKDTELGVLIEGPYGHRMDVSCFSRSQ